MIQENGWVVQAGKNWLKIKINRSSSCQHCQSKNLCQSTSSSERILHIHFNPGLTEGDRVKLSLPERGALWASVIVYLLPLALLTGGAFGSHLYFNSQAAAAIGAFVMLGTGFFLIYLIGKISQQRGTFNPKIEKIL